MARKKRRQSRPQQAEQLEKETAEQVEINPVAAAERLIAQLSNEFDRAWAQVNRAIGDVKESAALVKAGGYAKRLNGFSNDVARLTGQNRFVIRWNFQSRLTDRQKQLWSMLKHSVVAPELPAGATAILEALKAIAPPPKIIEGENEWREYLAKNNLVESDPNAGYESRTKRRIRTEPAVRNLYLV